PRYSTPPLGAEYEKEKKPRDRKTDTKKSKNVASSDEESVQEVVDSSEDEVAEEGELQIQLNPEAVDVTLDNIAPAMVFGWIVHPNNNKLEYSCNYTINSKCIVKMAATSAYIGLCTLERLNGNGGDDHMLTIEEQRILEKLKMRPLSELEQKELHQQESEEESSSQEESATDEEDDDKDGDEDNPPKWTVEMVDAYKEHPDVLWRVLNEFRKKINDGHGKTYEDACKLEEKLKKFNNLYAHGFMVLDLAMVVRNFRKQIVGDVIESSSEEEDEEEIHVGRPEDKSKVKWKTFDKDLEYSKNPLVRGKHIVKKRKENIVVGLATKDDIRSGDMKYDSLSLKEKKRVFTLGFIPNIAYDDTTTDEESSADEVVLPKDN
ncbi:hypothetical protein EDD11_000268, partial [Mortierella claussenii]